VSNYSYSKTFPLKREQIPVKTFEKLWDELQKVLREAHQLALDSTSRNSARFFGMGDFAPDLAPPLKTVASVIAGHPDVKEFLGKFPEESAKINFGDFLYKRLRDLTAAKSDVITFGKRAYVYGYFLFLGFQNKEAFEKAHGLNEQPGNDISALTHLPQKSSPVYYLGSFFSVRSYIVKHFIISISYDNPISESENTFPTEEWGFHRLDDIDSHQTVNGSKNFAEYKLVGTALIRNNKLYMNLTTPETEQNWTQMNIIGWGYGAHPDHIKAQRIIRCIVQTVSVMGYPVASEAVLVRMEEQKWNKLNLKKNQVPSSEAIRKLLGETETEAMILYLMLQRRNFWIKNEFVDNLLSLKVRGSLMTDYLYLKGIWRVWNYGLRRGHVMQSKLVINDRYVSTFYPYLNPNVLKSKPGLETQVATLFISKGIRPNKLFFHTYLKPNLAIVNTAIFDLDTIYNKNKNNEYVNYAEGMFLSGGYDPKGIIGGYCVMKKLEAGEEDFEPMEFTREEALAYEEKHNIKGLYNGLRDLWRNKTWPRRKVNEIETESSQSSDSEYI